MRRSIKLFVLAVLSFGFSLNPIQAKESDKALLKLPWDSLKQILKIERTDVRLTWEEFQTLLQHTGSEEIPQFSIRNGDVVLSQKEFNRLIQNLKPPNPQTPGVYLTNAFYRAKLLQESIVIRASLRLHVRKSAKKHVRIDLFPGNLAFQEILLDGKPALVEQEGGRLYLTTDHVGQLKVNLVFSIKTPDAKRTQQVSFRIPKTPITQLELTIPDKNIDAKVNQALHTETQRKDGNTIVNSILRPAERVQISWNPVVPEKNRGPSKVYVDTDHLLSIEDDALRVRSTVNLNVLQNTINSIQMDIPKGFDIIEVKGIAIGEWKEIAGDSPLLNIPFTHARKGTFNVSIVAEQIFSEDHSTSEFSGYRLKNSVRQTGTLGVELRTSAEVTVSDHTGLDRIDIKELPQRLLILSSRPLLYGYRFRQPTFKLNMDVKRHDDVRLVSSVIDLASGVSLIMEDGKIVHQITYKLKNSWKQFLEVPLPPGTSLWSAFVAGKPVKPSKGKDGFILIPLNRSKNSGSGLSTFEVELVYFGKESKLLPFGRKNLSFPVPDTIISRLFWSVYMPHEYQNFYFGNKLKKVKPEPISTSNFKDFNHRKRKSNIFGKSMLRSAEKKLVRPASRRNATRELQNRPSEEVMIDIGSPLTALDSPSDGRDMVDKDAEIIDSVELRSQLVEDDFNYQKLSELKFLGQSAPQSVTNERVGGKIHSRKVYRESSQRKEEAGVLPIRVRIPVVGEAMRFSKTLLMKGEPVPLTTFYISKGFLNFLKGLAVLIFLYFFFQMRHALSSWMSHLWRKCLPYIEGMKPVLTPTGFMFLSMALCLGLSYLSGWWLALGLTLFLISVGRWLYYLVRTNYK